MSDCHNRYGISGSKDENCSPALPVSHLLRASAFVATAVFLCITILLLVCILHKHRLLLLVRLRQSAQRTPPALYIWSGIANDSDQPALQSVTISVAKSSLKGAVAAAAEPVSCVIMAGDDRPTHLARPLPRKEFEGAGLDAECDELERGKGTPTLDSPR